MRNAVNKAFAVALMSLALSACGGGGGGGGDGGGNFGNTLPPVAGPGDVENLFPVGTGDTWNYYGTTTGVVGAGSFMDRVTVTGTRPVAGTNAYVFLEDDPSGAGASIEGYYAKTAGGLAFLGTNDPTDTVTPALVPYLVALYPVAPATIARFAKAGLDFGEDLDGDNINERVDVSVTTAIAGFEPLTIGLGTFPRTLKATDSQSGSVISSLTRTTVGFTSTVTRWAAPGVGILRSTQDTAVQAATSRQVLEARGYVVGGTPHGFGSVATLAAAPSDTHATTPALASDGTQFLQATETAAGLVAQVFDTTGSVLGTTTLTGTVGPMWPAATFDGTNYWVVFSPYSNGTSGSVTQVLARRLSAAGAPRENVPIVLASVAGNQFSIGSTALAFGSGSGLLAYTAFNGTTNQHELWGVVVNPDGTTGAGGAFPIAIDNATHLFPAIAFDGTNFLVAWQQLASSGATAGSIFATRVTPAGAVLDNSPLQVATAPNGLFQPSVAFDGANYLVVWIDQGNGGASEIHGGRVAPGASLTLLDGPAANGGFAIATGGTVPRSAPRVAFNGTEYLVAWTHGSFAVAGALGVQAVRVTTGGATAVPSTMAIPVSGAPATNTSAQYRAPVLARRGNQVGVLWQLSQTTGESLQASVFSPL